MEAMGQPMKIQMTQTTANILENNGGFNVEPRGQIEIPKVRLVHFRELFELRQAVCKIIVVGRLGDFQPSG